MTRRTPAAAVALIQRFEGWRDRPYLCPAGYWTIGWGALRGIDGKPVTRDTPPITQAEGEALLARDLRAFESAVARLARVPLQDGQFGALVSFTFNLGAGRLQASTLLRRLNGGDYRGAADEFPKWTMAGGRRLPGLVLRREAERGMFLTPDPEPPALPLPAPPGTWLNGFMRAFTEAAAGRQPVGS